MSNVSESAYSVLDSSTLIYRPLKKKNIVVLKSYFGIQILDFVCS